MQDKVAAQERELVELRSARQEDREALDVAQELMQDVRSLHLEMQDVRQLQLELADGVQAEEVAMPSSAAAMAAGVISPRAQAGIGYDGYGNGQPVQAEARILSAQPARSRPYVAA